MASGIVSDFPVKRRRINETVSRSPGDGKWWSLPTGKVHEGVTDAVNAIQASSINRSTQLDRWSELYDGRLLSTENNRDRPSVPRIPRAGRLAVNVIKSCVDTAAAKIAKNVPRPLFLTSEGDWSLQRKAKWLTRYVEGTFYDSKVHDVAQDVFVDSLVWGTGIIGMGWEESEHGPKLTFERVLPVEMLVDEEEARYRRPRQIHHVRWWSLDVVLEMFPDKANEITQRRTTDSTKDASQIRVRESWHLPSGLKAKDGKHAVTIDGVDLLVESYEAPYFPFAFFRWTDARVGFWGVGLAEQLTDIQYNINRTAMAIQQAQNLVAAPRIFVEKGTQIATAHLNAHRDRLPVVQYVGRPPSFQTPTAMNPEAYQWLDKLIKLAYETTGISQMTANAVKPAGLNSGAAIREFNDNASERFVLTGLRWEALFLDIAEKIVDMSRRLSRTSGGEKLSVKSPDGRFVKQVKWKDADLDDDTYHLKVYSTSWLPTTPSARMEAINEYAQAGMLSKESARALMDFPDLEADTDLATAAANDVKRTIEDILENGKPHAPDELSNLQMALDVGMSSVLNAEWQGYPPNNVEMLRRWVDAVRDALQTKQEQEAPPPGPAPGGPPPPQQQPPPQQPGPPSDQMLSDDRAKLTAAKAQAFQDGVLYGDQVRSPKDSVPAPAYWKEAQQASQPQESWRQAWAKTPEHRAITNIIGTTALGPIPAITDAIRAHNPGLTDGTQGPIGKVFGAARAAGIVEPHHESRRMQTFERDPDASIADANRSMAGQPYTYLAGLTPPNQRPGEVNVGPMAQNLEKSPVAATAVRTDPHTGLKTIDKDKALKVVMAGLANVQQQQDQTAAQQQAMAEELGVKK